jgi:hypothetical protein
MSFYREAEVNRQLQLYEQQAFEDLVNAIHYYPMDYLHLLLSISNFPPVPDHAGLSRAQILFIAAVIIK